MILQASNFHWDSKNRLRFFHKHMSLLLLLHTMLEHMSVCLKVRVKMSFRRCFHQSKVHLGQMFLHSGSVKGPKLDAKF